MSAEFEYAYLFWALRLVIKECKEFNASCECKDCKYVRRVRVYFNILKSHSENPRTYSDFCIMMVEREEDWLVNSFLYSFLKRMDEDSVMTKLFDDKEDMTNEEYVTYCNALMAVKKFKNIMAKCN
jgi:hypothetical protein